MKKRCSEVVAASDEGLESEWVFAGLFWVGLDLYPAIWEAIAGTGWR